jgi:hypothetical protein
MLEADEADEDDVLDPGLVDEYEEELEPDPEVEAESSESDEENEVDEEAQDSAPAEEDLPGDDSADTGSKNGVQKRIDELTRQKKEAGERGDRLEQEKRELEARLEALEAKLPKEPELAAPVRPRLEDFETDEAYEAALDQHLESVVEFKLKKKAQEEREAAKAEESRKLEQEKAERIEQRRQWLMEVNAAKPGLAARVASLPVLSEASSDALASMDVDAGITAVEYLEANPEQAYQIATLDPDEQKDILMEIGTGKPANSRPGNKVTKAPRPTKPTGGRRKVPTKDPLKMSPEEYDAWRASGGGK